MRFNLNNRTETFRHLIDQGFALSLHINFDMLSTYHAIYFYQVKSEDLIVFQVSLEGN